jgi:hypothetical protein
MIEMDALRGTVTIANHRSVRWYLVHLWDSAQAVDTLDGRCNCFQEQHLRYRLMGL